MKVPNAIGTWIWIILLVCYCMMSFVLAFFFLLADSIIHLFPISSSNKPS